MTARNDLDPILAGWFDGDGDVVAAPPEPLARVIESTRTIRPRPALTARIGSHWVAAGSTGRVSAGVAGLRPAFVLALVGLLALALAGGAVLVGSRLLAPPQETFNSQFDQAPDLSRPMAFPLLTPLLDGSVLVIGAGSDGKDRTATALLYEPTTGVSTPLGPMAGGTVGPTVLLQDGRVLIVGAGAAEIFDPTTMRFAAVGAMVDPRAGAAVALLHDGRVLVAGGWVPGVGERPNLSSAELFDPGSLTFSPTGPMGSPGYRGPMATLPDGRVFAAPIPTTSASGPTAEVYDPGTGTFSTAGTLRERDGDGTFEASGAIVMPDGRVVVVGSARMGTSGRTAIWDPATRTFLRGASAPGPVFSATLLDEGQILLTGGGDSAWASIYDPTTGAMIPIEPPAAWRPSLARLADGGVLVVGGLASGEVHQDPVSGGCCMMAPAVPTVEIFR